MKKLIVCISLIGFIGLVYLFNNEEYSNKIAVMIEKNGTYEENNKIPTKGYEFNKEKSICSNVEDISYSNNKLTLSNLSKDKTSCYLYFDEPKSGKVLKELGLESKGETTNFDGTSCGDSSCTYQENGVYEVEDDFGTSYYFRGTVDNNWVKFGKDSTEQDIYWRIIRINGDGTIRLIYSGNGRPEKTGDNTQISAQSFNSSYDDNMYVGYQFVSGNAHGFGKDENQQSYALTQLNTWFKDNLEDEFLKENGFIDSNAGFCNDRSSSTSNKSWSEEMKDTGGTGTTATLYGAYLRLAESSKQPTLKCSTIYDDINNKNKDYFTYTGATGIKQNLTGTKSLEYPIGLITADEVAFAGGVYGQTNSNYWLNTDKNYWTMSPYSFPSNKFARMIYVRSTGWLYNLDVNSAIGLRPVINLKADTQFTGEGNTDHPFEVKEVN